MSTNSRVASLRALQSPSCVFEDVPGDVDVYSQVIDSRQAIDNMLVSRDDDRLLVVVGLPRSSADVEALSALASQLKMLDYSDELLFVLQGDALTHHEPQEDGSYQINQGLRKAREELLSLNRLGISTALEFRDTITPQFFADVLSWASVSTRSETLQELVSGLSMPVGLRGPTADVASVLRAIDVSGGEHHFLGVSAEGVCGIVKSKGNPDVIAVLDAHNSAAEDLDAALSCMHAARPATSLMVELSPQPCDMASLERVCDHICRRTSLGERVGESFSPPTRVAYAARVRPSHACVLARVYGPCTCTCAVYLPGCVPAGVRAAHAGALVWAMHIYMHGVPARAMPARAPPTHPHTHTPAHVHVHTHSATCPRPAP